MALAVAVNHKEESILKYNNIISFDLWERIKETLSRTERYGWQPVLDHLVECCSFDKDWITNLISEHETRNMKPEEPVFIVSQTGTGKSTYILKVCLKVANQEKKKILYLCNRVALSSQMKLRCIDEENNQEHMVSGVMVSEMKQYFTEKYIAESHDFGGIDVYTYHSFLFECGSIDFSQYAFCILDEAHYVLSDATFNPYTEEVLEMVINKMKDTRRIYLSATPQECLQTIYDKEYAVRENQMNAWSKKYVPDFMMKVYCVEEDYSYLNPMFFSKADFIIEQILSSTTEDFWFVFVRDKATGEKFVDQLKNVEGGVKFITAESDKEDSAYKELIMNEKLPKRVLISTKVLDVGINVNNENLHMVLFENNIVELKQMLGRKRIKQSECVDAYFYLPSYDELHKRFGRVDKTYTEQRRLVESMDYFHIGFHTGLEHPLYFHGKKQVVKANYLSLKKLNLERKEYQYLLDYLENCKDNANEYNAAYATYILKHFSNIKFNANMIVDLVNESDIPDDESIQKVKSIVQKYIGKVLTKEELARLAEELTLELGDPRADHRKDRKAMGPPTLRKLLEKYSFELKSRKTTPVTYKILVLTKDGE